MLHCLLLAAALANNPAPATRPSAAQLDEGPAALSARLMGELDQPQAISDIFRLYERRDDQGDLTPMDATLAKASSTQKARPDVRALATQIRGQLALAKGQLAQAQSLFDAIAPVRNWSVVGPFENEGRQGLTAAYQPETDGFDPKAVYKGKEHDVAWRALPDGDAPYGFVDLSAAVYPRQDIAVYAATVVRSPKTQAAIFHFGASGASRVWLNGKLVHEDVALHPSRFDQQVFAGQLAAGDNYLLVKIAHQSGRLSFALRLADAKDRPLTTVAKSSRAPDAPATAFAVLKTIESQAMRKQRLPKVQDAVAELKERAAKNPQDARAQEDLAIALAWRRPGDETERLPLHAMERVAEVAPSDVEAALRLARLQDRDVNKRRQALDDALSANPMNPALLEALAEYRLDRGDGWQALDLAQKAQTASPSQLDAALVQARALDAVGLSARATLVRIEAAKAHPDSARAHRAAAAALRQLGRIDEAEAELKTALQIRFDDAQARGELVSIAKSRGDLDLSLKLLGEEVALEPAALRPRLHAAELLSQNGRADDAKAVYAQALALAPDDPEMHEQLGRARLRKNDDSGALAAFARSLGLRPQNPQLRELVRSVRPEEQYASPYLYEPRDLAKLPPLAGEDVEELADLDVTKVFPNGLSSRTHQIIFRPLTARGVDQARSQSVQYSPDRQVLRIERARIIKKDGTVIESKSDGERSLSEPWYGLYYDVRARIVGFPQVQAGDVVELVTRLDDSGSNFFADYFGDFSYLQGTQARRVSDYVLLTPAGRTFYASATPLPNLVHTEGKLQDGGSWQRWTAREVAKLVPEPSMPGYSDLLAYVHVSTYKTWDEVGRFYWGLVKDQLRVTDEIRTAAKEAVAGIPESDEQARIRAVYDFVVSRTRYVGLEFGINSFKPYPVETILSRRFGDCKDKASLMHAMLEALGIDSRLTLLRMKHLGDLQTKEASLAVFNHAILYVPKYKLFLDGTAEFHGSGELPADDRGADVLVVDPAGNSQFFRTPDASPADNSDETRVSARIAEDGSAQVQYQGKARGSWTAQLRRAFEPAAERKSRAEEQLSRGLFPNLKITAIDVSDPHDIEKPFETHVSATAREFAHRSGSGLSFDPFGQRQSFMEAYAQLSHRALPQQLPVPQRTVIESAVELPAGWTAELPSGTQEEGPVGAFTVSYRHEAGKVMARMELTLKGGTLQPAQYPAFREFLGRLDAALRQRIDARPSTQTAALD
jgi:Flp pilus assembly protein TadD/transglutaminase-like putative cysteine protease